LVNFKFLLLLGLAIAFVAGGGIQFTRTAIDEAKKLKDDILPSSAKPKTQRIDRMTKQKLRDETGGVNT